MIKTRNTTAADIPWDAEAEKALSSVPSFVRGMVKKKVSERVAKNGGGRVTVEDFREAEARFRKVLGGKSEKELAAMVPRDNEPGVEMVIVEFCRNELSDCPNVLIDTFKWAGAIRDWIEERNINERIRERIANEKILYHHKIRIAVSGCPNGCSRPQIASIGVVGYVRPDVDPSECTFCGSCEDACPDSAIEVKDGPPSFDRQACRGCKKCRDICPGECIVLSEPGVRILAGGKLGRHPHLADPAGVAKTSEQMIEIIEKLIEDYIENAGPEERFSDYWLRAGKGCL